jgi:hypothetical protein
MAKGEIVGKRHQKGTWVKEYTLWTKIEIAILAYFKEVNNTPATYRDIARTFGRANYTDYKKSCEELVRRGYLERLENGVFKVRKDSWNAVKSGKETIVRDLPYFQMFLETLKKRSKSF